MTAQDANNSDVAFTAEAMTTVAFGGAPSVRASLSGSSGGAAVTFGLRYGMSPTYVP